MLTQVEVVVLSVSENHKTTNDVYKGCISVSSVISCAWGIESVVDIRMADGFFPLMYFREYHWRGPLARGSGAAPRGSFS